MTDTYRTLTQNVSEIIFKDKSSKFIGYAFPVNSEEEIKNHLENIKKEHFSARHWCYAWQLGKENKRYRANDDGEPSGTAGLPIYGQIQSYDLTNILLIVVRYFGGIKLGVSGLINAYKTTAQMTLQEAKIEERTIDIPYEIHFEYKNMNKVMKILKEKNVNVVNQKLEMDCRVYINVRKGDAQQIEDIFSQLYEVEIKKIEE
ncbi:MAG: YigZ family protein [Capnocytophaga sp.]|nr:YigZ family protein [Capnocytophaga sp.]